jgi:hypothetical protein
MKKSRKSKSLPDKQSNFLLYTGKDGKVNVEVFLKDETLWMTQKAIGELFGKERSVITKHLKSIFASGELEEKSNVQKMHFSHSDKPTKIYNLDAIISVGYRVNSYQATQFRIWATKTLKEYIIKGFVLDDERLKQGNRVFGKDYFDELLERIREIRASERRFYQKITDIYALSADYDKNAPITKEFFATVQSKLHWAITGKTAAEIIYDSADKTKIYMGLTNWKHAPGGKIKGSCKKNPGHSTGIRRRGRDYPWEIVVYTNQSIIPHSIPAFQHFTTIYEVPDLLQISSICIFW